MTGKRERRRIGTDGPERRGKPEKAGPRKALSGFARSRREAVPYDAPNANVTGKRERRRIGTDGPERRGKPEKAGPRKALSGFARSRREAVPYDAPNANVTGKRDTAQEARCIAPRLLSRR